MTRFEGHFVCMIAGVLVAAFFSNGLMAFAAVAAFLCLPVLGGCSNMHDNGYGVQRR